MKPDNSPVREMRRLTSMRDRGTLSHAEYRAQRALLLDGLEGLAPPGIDVEPTRPPPSPRGDERAEPTARHVPAASQIAPTSQPQGMRFTYWLLVVGGAALALAAFGLWLWYD